MQEEPKQSGLNVSKLVLPVAVVIAGAIVFNKLLKAFGLSKSPEELAIEEARKKSLDAALKEAQAKAPSTKTDAEWIAIADIIYSDLKHSSIDDDKADAGYQVARVKNDTDVYKLIQAFGIRTEYAFGLPIMQGGLPEFITGNLDEEQISTVNDNYRRKGILFRW